MIDVRFHYKEDESEDRLGALQYQWLNDILEQNKDSNVTFIMSGVQILAERWGSFIEEINQPTKARLLETLRKFKKSGVVFLSGDVHFGQFYKSNCESFTGYKIPELCSSGLTHILNDMYPGVKYFVDGHTPLQFKVSL